MLQNNTREVSPQDALHHQPIWDGHLIKTINDGYRLRDWVKLPQLIIVNLLSCSPAQSMSPASGTGMSPSYPHSEPSPDYAMLVGARVIQRTPSASPPLTPNTVCSMMTSSQNGECDFQYISWKTLFLWFVQTRYGIMSQFHLSLLKLSHPRNWKELTSIKASIIKRFFLEFYCKCHSGDSFTRFFPCQI